MRAITAHKVNGCNEAITVFAKGEPGSGGANHLYRLEWDDKKWGPDPQSMRQVMELHFQEGPVAEVGTNGITHEVLLAIVADRLRSFQAGDFACPENENALRHVEVAMSCLHSRTKARLSRGVEGTHQK